MKPPLMNQTGPSRPIGVAVLAILAISLGTLVSLGGLVALGIGGLQFVAGAETLPPSLGIIILLLGVMAIVAGVGLWDTRTWAWWLTVIVAVVLLTVSGMAAIWITVAVVVFILVYLAAVRSRFSPRGSVA